MAKPDQTMPLPRVSDSYVQEYGECDPQTGWSECQNLSWRPWLTFPVMKAGW